MSLKIGVFDSGIGGFSILKELQHLGHEYVYIGDTLRAPYGDKTQEELTSCTMDLLSFLKNKEVDMYVSACNSLSTLQMEPILSSLHILREKYVSMIDFTMRLTETVPLNANVLLFATKATIVNGVYQSMFTNYNCTTLTSSFLAKAIEDGNQIVIDEEIDMLVDYVLNNKVSHIVLACTHYPLIINYIEKRIEGLSLSLLDPSHFIPEPLLTLKEDKESNVTVFLTKETEEGKRLSKELFATAPQVIVL